MVLRLCMFLSLLSVFGCLTPKEPSPTPKASQPQWDELQLVGKDKDYVRTKLGTPSYQSDHVWKYGREGNYRMYCVYFEGHDAVQRVSK